MESHVSHNNDRKYYRIAIDTAKEGDEIFNLTKYFKGRVGDRNYGLQMTWYEQGSLKNVKGLKPYIRGNVGHYSIGDNGEIIMAPDAAVVSYVGDPSDTDVAGRVVYHFPEQMFPQEGIFYGFIGLIDDSDGDQRLSGVNVWFKVLPGVAYMGKASAYYIGEMDKLIHNSEERIRQLLDQGQKDVDAKQAALQAIVDDYKTKMSDLIDRLNAQGQTANSMMETVKAGLSALETKIQQDGLFTQGEAKKFEEELTSRLFAKSTTVLNTVDDMKKDAGLTEGQVIITLGEYEIGDGGGATYRITNSSNSDSIALDNGLNAERIYLAKNNYYDEVTVTYDRVNHTNIYFATIPKEDRHGQPITPYIVQNGRARIYNPNTKQFEFKPAPSGEQLTPAEYARKHHTTLTVNGSSSINIDNANYPEGNIIGDGKILNTFTPPEGAKIPSNFGYIGFKQDRSIQEYPFNTTAQQMLDDGVINSWVYYWPLIKDSKVVDDSTFVGNEGRVKVTVNDPRIGLGIKADGTLIIAACDGRSLNQKGLTSSEFAQEMLKHGCVNAWHLDGGGSTSLTYKGMKLNRNIDNNGAADRAIPFTFNIKKPGADTGIADAYSQAGAAKQDTVRQLAPEIKKLDGQTTKWFGNINFKSDDELESWLKETTADNDWQAKSLSGIITTDYRNSAAGMAIGSQSIESWYATISWIYIAGKAYGSLKMTSKYGASDSTLYRSLYQSQWSDWIPSDHPHELVPLKVDEKVSVCKILRSGMTIQVDVKVVIDNLNDWTIIVKGLPHPIDEVQEIQLAGDNKARGMITTAGDVIVKGEAGLYYLHLTYFTNDRMD